MSFQWLEYSIQKDAIFCYPCRVFGTTTNKSEDTFVSTGFRNWKKVYLFFYYLIIISINYIIYLFFFFNILPSLHINLVLITYIDSILFLKYC